MTEFAAESAPRFAFGRNWRAFLGRVDEQRVEDATVALAGKFDDDGLAGRRFLDIGSGSGLMSLAARRLGARVVSFDFDPDSVACTEALRRRFRPDDEDWVVHLGSVLDQEFLSGLGSFDVVYSWGVLHHTGALWRAFDNAVALVDPGGRLFVAIYNDQGGASRRWRAVKRAYVHSPLARPLLLVGALPVLWWKNVLDGLARGRPFETWVHYRDLRGMSAWHNHVDWVGGYPFEVAKPEVVFDRARRQGFVLEQLQTCGGGIGCNEYVFRRESVVRGPSAPGGCAA